MTQGSLVTRSGDLKEAYAPSFGRNVKFGRRPVIAPGPYFRLERYLLASLPDEPPTTDYTTAGASTSAALKDIDGNDALGDCVIAWLYHHLALWTGNATGTAFHPTLDQVIAMYSAIGGYVPGKPETDQGCDMTVAMNWIVANGYANGDKPLGWVRVNGQNPKAVRQAIWLFEGCGFGVGLPDAYLASMPSADGFVWDAAGPSNPSNGHAYLGAGYDASGVLIDTWGLFGRFTWAAIAQYAVAASGGEIDILLSADMIASAAAKAPSGFDWASLVADFDAIGGSVPVPVPPPPPPPPPVPGAPVTLAQAQAWAGSGIAAQRFPLLTKATAVAAVQDALAKNWTGP